MQQENTTNRGGTQETTHVTLLTVQREVGVTRETLRKYLMYPGIEPICFHVGMCNLYISRQEMAQVAQLKQNPALLAQLPSRTHPSGQAARVAAGDDERKET